MVSSRSWLVLVFGVLRIDWESSAGFANQSLSEVGSSRNLSSSRRDCVTNHKRVWEGDYFSRCLKTAIMMVLSPVRGMSDRDGHGIKWIKECLYRRWKKWLQLTSWSLCCLFVRRDLFIYFTYGGFYCMPGRKSQVNGNSLFPGDGRRNVFTLSFFFVT